MIELRDFLNILIRRKTILLAGLCIGVAGGGVFAWRASIGVSGSLQLSVYREQNPAFSGSEYLTYDGYYLVETGRLFGERMADFMLGGAPQAQLNAAGIAAEVRSAVRLSPQDVRVDLWAVNRAAIEEAAKTVAREADAYTQILSSKPQDAMVFRVSGSLITLKESSPFAFVVLGGVLGILLGVCAVFLREYLS